MPPDARAHRRLMSVNCPDHPQPGLSPAHRPGSWWDPSLGPSVPATAVVWWLCWSPAQPWTCAVGVFPPGWTPWILYTVLLSLILSPFGLYWPLRSCSMTWLWLLMDFVTRTQDFFTLFTGTVCYSVLASVVLPSCNPAHVTYSSHQPLPVPPFPGLLAVSCRHSIYLRSWAACIDIVVCK